VRVHGEEEDIVPVTFLQYKHTLNATGGNSILYIHTSYARLATLMLVPHAPICLGTLNGCR